MHVTLDMLADALRRWKTEAEENNWPDRDDAEQHMDNAQYLFELMTEGKTNG